MRKNQLEGFFVFHKEFLPINNHVIQKDVYLFFAYYLGNTHFNLIIWCELTYKNLPNKLKCLYYIKGGFLIYKLKHLQIELLLIMYLEIAVPFGED